MLVVDDTAFSRKKLTAAAAHLGLEVETASDGEEALARLPGGGFDLVLLDILMPKLDGYGVLRTMRDTPDLRDIPVLVVSTLEEVSDVVPALELGAVDFLAKNVEPPIFKARVLACLEKKRLRDLELSYLSDVEKLTAAAQTVRATDFNPDRLRIGAVTRRSDGLGELARVFSEMASAVHAREKAARERINLLQGGFLLLLMGASWGVVPALSKLLAGGGPTNPLGVAAWVALVTLTTVSVVMVATGTRAKLNRRSLGFALVIGAFAGVLPQVSLFWVANHVPGAVISIILALETMIVYALATLLRIESPSRKRFIGLLIGLAAVAVVMMPSGSGGTATIWVLAALIVPSCYAIESILVAALSDEEYGPLDFLFLIMLGSTIWAWTASTVTGSVLLPSEMAMPTMLLIAAIGVISAISTGCYVLAIRKTGAVFASQYAYVVTLMGVGWSVLLLDERLSLWIWIALGCVLVGMFMVRPKEDDVLLDPEAEG